jgi:hypothetical protein
MTSQAASVSNQSSATAQVIFDIATGFMRAKHLFVAGELEIFETLAKGPLTLKELANRLGTPQRTTRIIADAVNALGWLERDGDKFNGGRVLGSGWQRRRIPPGGRGRNG